MIARFLCKPPLFSLLDLLFSLLDFLPLALALSNSAGSKQTNFWSHRSCCPLFWLDSKRGCLLWFGIVCRGLGLGSNLFALLCIL